MERKGDIFIRTSGRSLNGMVPLYENLQGARRAAWRICL
jgi:hypothetical protein